MPIKLRTSAAIDAHRDAQRRHDRLDAKLKAACFIIMAACLFAYIFGG